MLKELLLVAALPVAIFAVIGMSKPPTEAEKAEQAKQAQQAMLIEQQRQACEARPGMVWSNYRKECGKACDYECIQNFKYMRRVDQAWADAMNPWKD